MFFQWHQFGVVIKKNNTKKNSIAPDSVAKQGHEKGIVKAIQDILTLIVIDQTT